MSGAGCFAIFRALKFGNRASESSTIEAQRDLLGLFTRSAAEWLEDWFESEPVKAAFGFDAVVGNYASPYHPGTAYVLLHHCFGEVNGKRGHWGHAIGGMGAISEALAAEARRLGVEIECDAPVAQVRPGAVRAGRRPGDRRRARSSPTSIRSCCSSSWSTRALLERDFRERMERYKCGSATFRMNVALSALPRFACLPEAGPHHASGIILAPSLGYMDRAYLDARADGIAARADRRDGDSRARSTTRSRPRARTWRACSASTSRRRPTGAAASRRRSTASSTWSKSHAPGFRQSVIAHSALSPADLEREFGLTGGDIFHGQLSLDQLWSARPVLGHADYRTPVKGLYLCGSGAHPGGGVTGAPGHNCAREVLRDFGRRMPA